uniref:Uncharacterized protein n=1 Tax=Amphiprion ocellaris TaxID=80972 RepID=A0AAQ5WWK2_AMPOC
MPATCTQESGENSKVSTEGGDTLNLPSPSGQTELEAADQGLGIDANNIKHLINEFNRLYEQRLKCLEVDAAMSREELQQKKVDFLQSYVNDLTDQNQLLAQTIEDLQREARHKVSSYGMKLHSSDHDLNVSEVNLKTLLLDEFMGPMVHIPHSTGSLVQIASESEDLEIQLQTKDVVISELERELRENLQQKQKTATQVLESTERLVHLQSELSCLQRIHKDNMKEIAEKDICITKLQANIQLLKQEGADTHAQVEAKMVHLKDELCAFFHRRMEEKEARIVQLTEELNGVKQKMKDREDRVRHLDQDVVALRATQDSLMRTLAMKEKHSEQLVQCNAQLKESLATLQSKLQTSECMLSDISETLDQTRISLNTDRQQKDKIQNELHHAGEEVERLQLELTDARITTEKQIQKKEIKLRALVRELTEHKKQLSECQKELLRREKALEKLREETSEQRAKMEDHSRECAHLNQTKDRLEADLALSHKKLHTSHLEVRSRDQFILQLRAEMKAAEQKHQGTQKQVTALEEEARHLNHKVRAREEEACQLSEKLRGIEHLKDQKETEQQQLYGQLQMSQQQKLTVERNLRLYQQSHSHSDEEYLSLSRLRQQLQERCTEQVERLAECEKAILQMKSELERQTQENVGLKQTLAASHRKHLSNRSELEDKVAHLKKEVTCLELELADTQKVQVTVRMQSEEELKEVRRESARRSKEVGVHKGEVQRLQEELQKEEEKMRKAIRENQSLSVSTRQLTQELKELRNKHQVTVEELAACAEEARRMEGCLNEGKLAEEKIRSMAARLEKEVTELRKNLQQAVDQKFKAEREKQDAQDQVNSLRSELEGTRSDNLNLRHESQLVMTNVGLWITEQKASNESLTAQMKAQNKVLLIVTEEKEHLQEANDTLKAEVKRLKEVADEKERDMERFKAQIRDRGIRQDGKTMEKKGCVALNLSKIEDMQTRLQGNLEAIGMLNQQLNALSGENKRLRRQLEEERSMRGQVVQLLPPPPTSQRCSSIHLPLSHRAHPPPSASLPSTSCLPRPLGPETWDPDGILSQTKLSRAGSERPGESQVLGEVFRIRPTAECADSTSLEDVWSGRTSRHLAK